MGYLVIPDIAGNYASTPDTAAVSPTGTFEIRADILFDDYTRGGQTLVGKYVSGGDQRAFIFDVNAAGNLSLRISSDGAVTDVSLGSGVTFTNGTRYQIRVEYTATTGATTFTYRVWTGQDLIDNTGWLAAGTDTNTETSVFDSSAVLAVGAAQSGGSDLMQGNLYRVILYNSGIVFDADFTNLTVTSGVDGETFTEDSSNAATITINGSEWSYFFDPISITRQVIRSPRYGITRMAAR